MDVRIYSPTGTGGIEEGDQISWIRSVGSDHVTGAMEYIMVPGVHRFDFVQRLTLFECVGIGSQGCMRARTHTHTYIYFPTHNPIKC